MTNFQLFSVPQYESSYFCLLEYIPHYVLHKLFGNATENSLLSS